MPVTLINQTMPAKDFEQITVSSVSIGFTASKLTVVNEPYARSGGMDLSFVEVKRMEEAFVTVETNPIRYTLDGTTPTAAVGHLLQPGDSLVISGVTALTTARFIRQGAADGAISVTYFRRS